METTDTVSKTCEQRHRHRGLDWTCGDKLFFLLQSKSRQIIITDCGFWQDPHNHPPRPPDCQPARPRARSSTFQNGSKQPSTSLSWPQTHTHWQLRRSHKHHQNKKKKSHFSTLGFTSFVVESGDCKLSAHHRWRLTCSSVLNPWPVHNNVTIRS